MNRGGLYSGFESYRVPSPEDIGHALRDAMIAVDANVLLNLYRYNQNTADDLLRILAAVGDRLFVPNQVVREFWRNRQAVIAGLGGAYRDAAESLRRHRTNTLGAVSQWAKNVALPDQDLQPLLAGVDRCFDDLLAEIGEGPERVDHGSPTADDNLLGQLEKLLDGAVGAAMSQQDWSSAVAEGDRRVDEGIPPGYMDADKRSSNLPEKASGDYLVWRQLLDEGAIRRVALVFVTADTKEDWWIRTRGVPVGPRRELIEEYTRETGSQLYLLQPSGLLEHSAVLGVVPDTESVRDVERIRAQVTEHVPWTLPAVHAVLHRLDVGGHVQAEVIREAIDSGGRISRARIYEIDQRDESTMLRGFTKPVKRVTADLQSVGEVPSGVSPLLSAIYEAGVKLTHFAVPAEVVDLFIEADEL